MRSWARARTGDAMHMEMRVGGLFGCLLGQGSKVRHER